jgi:hypothetical protein
MQVYKANLSRDFTSSVVLQGVLLSINTAECGAALTMAGQAFKGS